MSRATHCESALLLQLWGSALPGAKFLWGLLVLCGFGDFLNAKGAFYRWLVLLGQSFSRFLPKRRQFFLKIFILSCSPSLFSSHTRALCPQATASKAGPAWPVVLSWANQTWISKRAFFKEQYGLDKKTRPSLHLLDCMCLYLRLGKAGNSRVLWEDLQLFFPSSCF